MNVNPFLFSERSDATNEWIFLRKNRRAAENMFLNREKITGMRITSKNKERTKKLQQFTA
jgi:hypothetical protein